jgi:hypothetical protein
MKSLIVGGDLQRSCELFASPTLKSVVVLSGFPCCVAQTPPSETDGPPGTYAIVRAAVGLGYTDVTVVTDECNQAVFQAAHESFMNQVSTMWDSGTVTLEAFPSTFTEDDERRFQRIVSTKCDLLISCERAGPGQDGNCYTMRGINMTAEGLIAPLHRFVNERSNTTRLISIGDGGNELGMGKVIENIINNPKIHNGALIGCVIPADYLIAASVSNWGGYALAIGAAIARAEQTKQEDGSTIEGWINKCVPTEDDEIDLLNKCVGAGCRDGVTGRMEATVDGMPLETSLQCLRDLRQAAMDCR